MGVHRRLVCRALTLMVGEILDVDVGAESGVVGQVPAVVVGIFVDDDGIAVPIPVVGVVVIVGSYAEIEAAEPKALAISSAKVIDVAAAKAAGEAAVFPGMIEMIVRVAATGIMADPSGLVKQFVTPLRQASPRQDFGGPTMGWQERCGWLQE